MQGPPSYSQQRPYVSGTTYQAGVGQVVRQIAIILIPLLVFKVMMDTSKDDIVLKGMAMTLKILHGIARTVGEWAIEVEDSYNEYVVYL